MPEFPVATTPSPGIMGVDWEVRVDFERLRQHRSVAIRDPAGLDRRVHAGERVTPGKVEPLVRHGAAQDGQKSLVHEFLSSVLSPSVSYCFKSSCGEYCYTISFHSLSAAALLRQHNGIPS